MGTLSTAIAWWHCSAHIRWPTTCLPRTRITRWIHCALQAWRANHLSVPVSGTRRSGRYAWRWEVGSQRRQGRSMQLLWAKRQGVRGARQEHLLRRLCVDVCHWHPPCGVEARQPSVGKKSKVCGGDGPKQGHQAGGALAFAGRTSGITAMLPPNTAGASAGGRNLPSYGDAGCEEVACPMVPGGSGWGAVALDMGTPTTHQ